MHWIRDAGTKPGMEDVTVVAGGNGGRGQRCGFNVYNRGSGQRSWCGSWNGECDWQCWGEVLNREHYLRYDSTYEYGHLGVHPKEISQDILVSPRISEDLREF
jgi:hypothetical protein